MQSMSYEDVWKREIAELEKQKHMYIAQVEKLKRENDFLKRRIDEISRDLPNYRAE